MELTKYERIQLAGMNSLSQSVSQIINETDDDMTYENVKWMIKTLDPWTVGKVLIDVLERREQEFPAVTYQLIDGQLMTYPVLSDQD
tara:strand:+ start:84 stop:344 length:261 start_codon:yes stop_codon:yes gene_type:complete